MSNYLYCKYGKYRPRNEDGEIINKLINERENWSSYSDINKIVELYILGNYINKVEYKNVVGKIINKVAKSSLENFYKMYSDLYISYHYVFWEMVSFYKIDINNDLFCNIKNNDSFSIDEIITNKYVSKRLSSSILNLILNCKDDIEYMIRSVFGNVASNTKEYWPKDEIKDNLDKITECYLNGNDVDFGYLEFMLENNEYKISESIKLDIFRMLRDKEGNERHNGMKNQVEISFEKSEKPISISQKNLFYDCVNIDMNFLQEAPSQKIFTDILKPIFFDKEFRWKMTSRKFEISHIERALTLSGKDNYEFGLAFKRKNFETTCIIKAVDEILRNNNKGLELIVKSILEDFLSVIGFKGFYFFEGYDLRYIVQRNRNLCAEIDSVMHQINHLIKYGLIDKDEIKFLRQPLNINQIKSFYEKKNIYLNMKCFQGLFDTLFDDQVKYNALNINSDKYNILEQFNNLFECLILEEVRDDDLENDYLDLLIKSGLFSIDKNKMIKFNKIELLLLNDIYINEYLNYIRIDDNSKKIIDGLEDSGLLTSDNHMFSDQECDYFCFIMNDQKFGNSLTKRNGYQHGSVSSNCNVLEEDYYELLKVLFLVVFKIYDELTLKYFKDA